MAFKNLGVTPLSEFEWVKHQKKEGVLISYAQYLAEHFRGALLETADEYDKWFSSFLDFNQKIAQIETKQLAGKNTLKELAELKKMFIRTGFSAGVNSDLLRVSAGETK